MNEKKVFEEEQSIDRKIGKKTSIYAIAIVVVIALVVISTTFVGKAEEKMADRTTEIYQNLQTGMPYHYTYQEVSAGKELNLEVNRDQNKNYIVSVSNLEVTEPISVYMIDSAAYLYIEETLIDLETKVDTDKFDKVFVYGPMFDDLDDSFTNKYANEFTTRDQEKFVYRVDIVDGEGESEVKTDDETANVYKQTDRVELNYKSVSKGDISTSEVIEITDVEPIELPMEPI